MLATMNVSGRFLEMKKLIFNQLPRVLIAIALCYTRKCSTYRFVKFPNGVFAINRLGITSIEATFNPAKNPINP